MRWAAMFGRMHAGFQRAVHQKLSELGVTVDRDLLSRVCVTKEAAEFGKSAQIVRYGWY